MTATYFFAHVFLPLTLLVVMLGMGLSLTFGDFKRVWQQPRSLTVGLLCQLLLLPAIAFGLAVLSPLSPTFKVGLVLMAACPGGISSGLVTHLFRGNVALSIVLTACNSFFTLLTIPITVNLALVVFMGETQAISLPIHQIAFDIFVLTIVPALAGVAIRHQFTAFATQLERPLRYLMPLLLGTAFTGVVLSSESEGSHTISAMLSLIPVSLLLNALGVGLTFGVVRLLGFDKSVQVTLPVEAGLHNSSLAIYIASAILANTDMALVGVAYGSITFFTTVFWVWVIYRYAS